jgi:hypothetical protein
MLRFGWAILGSVFGKNLEFSIAVSEFKVVTSAIFKYSVGSQGDYADYPVTFNLGDAPLKSLLPSVSLKLEAVSNQSAFLGQIKELRCVRYSLQLILGYFFQDRRYQREVVACFLKGRICVQILAPGAC